jgi:hypothetical protein
MHRIEGSVSTTMTIASRPVAVGRTGDKQTLAAVMGFPTNVEEPVINPA